MSARHVEERASAPAGDGRGGGGRCGGRAIRLKALDSSAGANYYQRVEEQGLRSGASHPGELLASGWISEESNTGRKIMGGGRRVEGGRDEERRGRGSEGRCEKEKAVWFLFSFLARTRAPSLVLFNPPCSLLQLPQN